MIRSLAASVAAGLLLTAAPASAAAPQRTALTVSYQSETGFAAAVVLRCDPVGGAHPKKAEVCRSLARVGGNPGRLAPAARMCTMEFAPITAEVKGTWQGRKVNWSRTFGNSCDMHRTTGVLTAF